MMMVTECLALFLQRHRLDLSEGINNLTPLAAESKLSERHGFWKNVLNFVKNMKLPDIIVIKSIYYNENVEKIRIRRSKGCRETVG
jgi:hypothetical protein